MYDRQLLARLSGSRSPYGMQHGSERRLLGRLLGLATMNTEGRVTAGMLSVVAERLGVNELGESAKRSSSGTNLSSSRPLSAPAPPCSLLDLLTSYRGIRCFLPGRRELMAAYLLPQAEAAMCEDLQRLARCRRESAQRPVLVLKRLAHALTAGERTLGPPALLVPRS